MNKKSKMKLMYCQIFPDMTKPDLSIQSINLSPMSWMPEFSSQTNSFDTGTWALGLRVPNMIHIDLLHGVIDIHTHKSIWVLSSDNLEQFLLIWPRFKSSRAWSVGVWGLLVLVCFFAAFGAFAHRCYWNNAYLGFVLIIFVVYGQLFVF